LVELFRSEPTLAAWFLTHVFGEKIPDYQEARAEPCDFTDIGPKEFRGDTALALIGPEGMPIAGIDVEIQLGQDESRRWSWPVYVATLRSRLRCPTYLLVVSPKADVAEWCRTPIDLGHPGLVLRPLVLGPDRIPAVTDPVEAVAEPERAVLSAIAHGEDSAADEVFSALLAGLHKADDERQRMYYDIVAAALSMTAQRRLEEIMATTKEYQSDFARRYVAQGRAEGLAEGRAEGCAEGEARMLLMVLDARGIPTTPEVRDRIANCTDLQQLEAWARKAVTATTIDELFD
jgi:hypothetical protein